MAKDSHCLGTLLGKLLAGCARDFKLQISIPKPSKARKNRSTSRVNRSKSLVRLLLRFMRLGFPEENWAWTSTIDPRGL